MYRPCNIPLNFIQAHSSEEWAAEQLVCPDGGTAGNAIRELVLHQSYNFSNQAKVALNVCGAVKYWDLTMWVDTWGKMLRWCSIRPCAQKIRWPTAQVKPEVEIYDLTNQVRAHLIWWRTWRTPKLKRLPIGWMLTGLPRTTGGLLLVRVGQSLLFSSALPLQQELCSSNVTSLPKEAYHF